MPDQVIAILAPRRGAQRDEAGEAADAGHRQVEQQQIGIGIVGRRGAGGLEIARLDDRRIALNAEKRLFQRSPEQGMIIRYDYRRRPRHALPYQEHSRCQKTGSRPTSSVQALTTGTDCGSRPLR